MTGRIEIFDDRSEPDNGVKNDLRACDKHIVYSVEYG
jgi:hypothetical protein